MKCGPGDRLAALTIMTNSPYVSTANQMRDFAMAGNRAMRRAAAKADRKKGRPRVNHSRRRLIDVIEYAREGAQLVRPSEVARVKTERGVVEVAEVPAPADDHFRGVGKKVC